MAQKEIGRIETEQRGAVIIARIDGGPRQVFGPDIAAQLEELLDRVDGDPGVRAVVFTGTHKDRFISHAELRWLQEGGAAVPSVGPRGASVLARTAKVADKASVVLAPVLRRTPLWPAIELERMHQTFLRMNRSGVIFVAALNGSAVGLGAEFAWANDLRVMPEGNYFIGQPEILFGIMPGGGGTQRLTRLVGTHRSLVAILEGTPFSPAQALEIGAVDAVVPKDEVLDRAISLAEHFGARTKGSIAAIKRAVYFGGSMSLEDGLHVERTEFLVTALSKDGQRQMLGYMSDTEGAGELPLFQGNTYERAIAEGLIPRAAKGQ